MNSEALDLIEQLLDMDDSELLSGGASQLNNVIQQLEIEVVRTQRLEQRVLQAVQQIKTQHAISV